jgi:hypothetical protein
MYAVWSSPSVRSGGLDVHRQDPIGRARGESRCECAREPRKAPRPRCFRTGFVTAHGSRAGRGRRPGGHRGRRRPPGQCSGAVPAAWSTDTVWPAETPSDKPFGAPGSVRFPAITAGRTDTGGPRGPIWSRRRGGTRRSGRTGTPQLRDRAAPRVGRAERRAWADCRPGEAIGQVAQPGKPGLGELHLRGLPTRQRDPPSDAAGKATAQLAQPKAQSAGPSPSE